MRCACDRQVVWRIDNAVWAQGNVLRSRRWRLRVSVRDLVLLRPQVGCLYHPTRPNRFRHHCRLSSPRVNITFCWRLFTGVCLCLSVCLSARYSKIRRSYDHHTWRRNVPRWVLEIRLFWVQKVKGQGNEAQKHCRRGYCTLVSAGFL